MSRATSRAGGTSVSVQTLAARAAQQLETRHGVPVLTWPDQEPHRQALAARRAPRVLVVAPGQPPPTDTDELEDWIREPVDPIDLDARVVALARRSERWITSPEDLSAVHPLADRAPTADDVIPRVEMDAGIVRVGRRWVALSPKQMAAAAVLIDRLGEVVSRDEVAAVHASGTSASKPAATKSLMRRLSSRLATVGLTLHFVRGRGFLLELPVRGQFTAEKHL
jgi:hypothetical protein